MKLKEIKALTTDSFPIASIDRCVIESVGDPGDTQRVTVIKDGTKLNLYLKCKNHFLDYEHEGQEVSFMSGPPVKGKPTGLIFRVINGKPRVNVTERSVMKLHGGPEAEVTETQLTETPEQVEVEDGDQEEGPADNIIRECFFERLHILNILMKLNESTGNPFSQESLYPMVTSIYIDASKANKAILPAKPKPNSKKKFENYQKEHQPKALPPAKAKEDEAEVDEIAGWAIENKEKPYMKAIHVKSGDTLYKILKSPDRRVKLIRWALSCYYASKDAGKETAFLASCLDCVAKMKPQVQKALVNAAIEEEYIRLNGEATLTEIAEKIGNIAEATQAKFDPAIPLDLAKWFFGLPDSQKEA